MMVINAMFTDNIEFVFNMYRGIRFVMVEYVNNGSKSMIMTPMKKILRSNLILCLSSLLSL